MAALGHLLPAIARFAKDVPLPPTSTTAASGLAEIGTGPIFSIETIGVDTPPPTPTADVVIITTTPSSTATAAPATATAPSPQTAGSDNTGECRLLGSFAIFVQLGLGALALLSLVYKRWRERPQRPMKIWAFDVSKQVVGSVLVHVANVFMSLLTSGRVSIKLDPAAVATAQRLLMRRADDYIPNPCSFYLLNLAIDTTLGIPILIVLIRLTTAIVAYTPLGKPAESIQSGNYGSPPKSWWWFKQSIIYFCGLFGMKICVLIIFLALPWISRVGDWALGWTEGNEQLQIVFVMMLFPLIMNALQYYIIDSFIKQKTPMDDHRGDVEGGSEGVAYDHIAEDSDDEGDVMSSDELEFVNTGKPKITSPAPKDGEYDPEVDGDSPTVVGSSSSQRSEAGKLLPKELYPRE